ncbi:MAG: ribonucleoside-diphosphate reductase [Solirubrobacterales bacterium]|nr:ribonucleoside-diphosphate reductase [Solirubrobacterales bacterium]
MSQSVSESPRVNTKGVVVERRLTREGVHPFDDVEWELRDAIIGDPAKPAFEQRGVEFPRSWSQNATNIVAQKYFRGQIGSDQRENSVKQMIGRVAGTIAGWGREGGYFASDADGDAFEAELTAILLHQEAAFNSPVWFNVGFEEKPQCSACFILSVEDTMESILGWNTKEGNIFRGGSGSGINLSNIRGSMEPLKKGGTASGPVSFMRGADSWAGTIKSGGKTRRAAKMVVLDVDHPDIEHFITCKADEEKKAGALRDAGFDMSIDGEGFTSIQYQNANNSVRVSDDFMEACRDDAEWNLLARTTGEPTKTLPARELMNKIAKAAWDCADPGMQYDTIINRWHTSPESGRINASNPCFPGDARVHTTRGLVPIAELYAARLAGETIDVYSHRSTAGENGAEPRVKGEGVIASTPLRVEQTGVKPIVNLEFSNGATIRCTPNHRLWTSRGYVPAEELTTEDEVLLNDSLTPATEAPAELPVKVEALAKSFSRGGSVVHAPLPTHWSPSLAELTGHLIGDGCLTGIQTNWTYGGDDIADGMVDAHAEALNGLFGGVSRQEMDNGTVQLRIGSSAVRELFKGLGVSSARAHEKRIPVSVLTAPPEVQAKFLAGLFGADGCVSGVEGGGKANRYAGLGSRSKALLKDAQSLLNSFGIRSRIYRVSESDRPSFSYTRKDGTEVEYSSREGFDLRITGTDLDRFAERIGFSTPRKQAALSALLEETGRYQTKSAVKLINREDDGQEVVYNLSEPLHHSYLVDGFIVANCSEYMHVDNSACNLASINLMKFRRDDGSFDTDGFSAVVDTVFLAQEIAVGFSSYPTEEIGVNANAFRQLGLGYANLGALLMSNGMPYDSDAGRNVAAAITALMTGRAYRRSAEISAAMGPYEHYGLNREPHNNVMRMHRDASYEIGSEGVHDELMNAAQVEWDVAVATGEEHGYRNAQATVLAPTGTISFLMDCDTTGIEPDFSLVKFKELVGGGSMTIVNKSVPMALRNLDYSEAEISQIEAHINETNSIVGAPGLKQEHLEIFDVAVGERAISHMGHIDMMSATQPFLSGAISKTVNMPNSATVDDIAEAYTRGWEGGLKALAIYRDGSKTAQALRTDAQDEKEAPKGETSGAPEVPARHRMPKTRQSVTHKFSVGGHEGYITAGKYSDDSVGEIFLTDIGKEGSTMRGMMNAFATAISLGLQYGVPLEVFVNKFSYMRFDPEGITGNPEIPFAKSMPDYIMRWLASQFIDDPDFLEEQGIMTQEVRNRKEAENTGLNLENGSGNGGNGNGGNGNGDHAEPVADTGGTSVPAAAALTEDVPVTPAKLHITKGAAELGPACDQCGGMMQRTGACYTCSSCGNNTGCG